MGASFIERTLEGTLTAEQIKAKYEQMCSDAAYSSGNEYSGDWNMCPGVKVYPERVFESYEKAEEWLSDNCQKWENSIAVRFKHQRQETVKEPTYGGKKIKELGQFDQFNLKEFKLAAVSYGNRNGFRLTQELVLADQLTETQKAKAKGLIDAYVLAQQAHKQAADAFSDLKTKLADLSQQFTDFQGLKMARGKASLSLKALEVAKQRLQAYNDERKDKLQEDKVVALEEKWLIGGVAAS